MLVEIADIRIKPGQGAAFEETIERALSTITAKAKGARGYKLYRGAETLERYILQVTWETWEDHMIGYRRTPGRDEWRSMVSPFFAQPPTYEHFELAFDSKTGA